MERLSSIIISVLIMQICCLQTTTSQKPQFLPEAKTGIKYELDDAHLINSLSSDDRKCPVCRKKDQVVPIVYGKPGKKLMDKAKRGKVRLGGCVLSEDSKSRYCKRDDKEF